MTFGVQSLRRMPSQLKSGRFYSSLGTRMGRVIDDYARDRAHRGKKNPRKLLLEVCFFVRLMGGGVGEVILRKIAPFIGS